MAKNSCAANNRHEIMKKQRKEIDMISELPDELLIRILSLLPDADATRSRILSNRWKHLWAFLPNLHFVMPPFIEQVNKFNDSVDQILALRIGFPIRKLFLQCSYDGDNYRFNNSFSIVSRYKVDCRVYNWFSIVSQCKVEEIEYRFLADDTYDVKFHWNLSITFNTLTKLTLKGVVLGAPIDEIPFPCLKTLILQCTEHYDTHWLMSLISRCPVLEELCLDWPRLTCKAGIVKLCSRSMRRLTIKRSKFKDQELVIDAPKLEYLHLFACFFRKYTLMSPTSVVEAYISYSQYHNVIKLLRCIPSTKILTLTRESLFTLGARRSKNMPMFPNLVELEIPWVLNLFLILLSNMPNLEYLTFSDGHLPFGMNWDPTMEEASACLRFKLKEIFVVSYVKREEFAILSYLLKHANNLEKLTIGKVDPERRGSWLNIHRASKSCRIEFVVIGCSLGAKPSRSFCFVPCICRTLSPSSI
ncbi:F-box protein At4g22280-like [Rutidosis leptorrhynchoides]|uniref:F-box protein At4g22280-like n=1 Tax=Rutidosis leptorrhynchoides TaxID=125765 RepID=UPI003A99E6DB